MTAVSVDQWVRIIYGLAAFRVGLYKLNLLKDTFNHEQDLIPHFINPIVVTDYLNCLADEVSPIIDCLNLTMSPQGKTYRRQRG
jgi:hypothetical protein